MTDNRLNLGNYMTADTETVSAAAGAGIYGLVLAASGFISSASDESIVQPRSAEWGIVFGFSGISVLAVIAALTLLAGYTLTEDQAEEDGACASA